MVWRFLACTFDLACTTLGKHKKPNFYSLCEFTEKFMKDPVWWWCGVTFLCDNNTYPSLGLRLRLGCGNKLYRIE